MTLGVPVHAPQEGSVVPPAELLPTDQVPAQPAPPGPASGGSAWDHCAAFAGAVMSFGLGAWDTYHGQVLSAGGDWALLVAGLGLLGAKGITGVLPRN